MDKKKPTAKPAEAQVQTRTPLDHVHGNAQWVKRCHDETIYSLSSALWEIEFQFARFTTELIKETVRAAIVAELKRHCHLQSRNVHTLLEQIKALGPEPAAKRGAR